MILIDNYDSFTYNIVEYFNILGHDIKVFKNDEITINDLKSMNFERIILSAGPHNPDNAGITMEVINHFYKTKKILGICLGFQAIAQYFGAEVLESNNPYHGKVSKIYFEEDLLFNGMNQGFNATRYHSLIIQNPTEQISITAKTKDNIPMGLKIKDYPIYGVQFHPESIMTNDGIKIFSNFMLS